MRTLCIILVGNGIITVLEIVVLLQSYKQWWWHLIFYFWHHCCICHHSGWIFFLCMIFYFTYMKFFENVFSWNRNKGSGRMNRKVINISLFLPWIWPWMKSGWLSLPDTVIVTVIVNKTTTSFIPYNHELELHADHWKMIS